MADQLAESSLADRLAYHANGDSLKAVRKSHPFAASIVESYFREAAAELRTMREALEKLRIIAGSHETDADKIRIMKPQIEAALAKSEDRALKGKGGAE